MKSVWWIRGSPVTIEPLSAQERDNLWRVPPALGALALIAVVSHSTAVSQLYATLAWASWAAGMMCTVAPKSYLHGLGRRQRLLQREIGDALILPGRRRRDAVSFIGLLAMLPQTVLWALDERHSTQLLSIFMATMFWIAAGAGTLGAVICLIRLLRSDNVLRIDATGIACPQLWGAVIPWSRIAGIRTDGTREDTALTITFNRPMDLELQKRSRLTWSAKLDAEKRTLTIPGALLSVPADDLAVLLQDRLRHQGQEPQ